MEVLKLLINEFAIFSLPSDQESQEDDSLDSTDGQDEIGFSVNANGDDVGETDETEDEDAGCQCNCPSHKKSDDVGGIEDNKNIEVIDGEDETGEPEEGTEDEEDDVDSENDEDRFKFF